MTASTHNQFTLQNWVVTTLLFWLFGAATQLGILWGANTLVGAVTRVDGDNASTAILIATVVTAIILYKLLGRRFLRITSCVLAVGWWLSYFVVQLIAAVLFSTSGISLVAYLAIWLILAAFGAVIAQASRHVQVAALGGLAATGAGMYAATRQQEVLHSSGFGRVPPSTVILLSQHVRTAQQAAAQLPPQIPAPFRDATLAIVLDHLVRDWWQNQNLEGLRSIDQQDMLAFVQYAWHVCRVGPESSEAALAAFRAVLGALLDDWCESWNADAEGAPLWQHQSA